jgi:hypothetical protein
MTELTEREKKLTLQDKIEKEWCELNFVSKVREDVSETFPQFDEREQEVMVHCLVNGFTPVTNIVGSVAARFYKLPTGTQRNNLLQLIVRMAENDHLNIHITNIAYVEPLYSLEKITKSRRHFIPPLLMKPKPVKSNEDTGYHIVAKGHLVLGHAANQHSGDISLDVINIQNKSPWRINQWVIDNCRDEKPEAMIQEEWDQFQEDTVELVTLLGTNRKIYLTHRVDKRGRLYCHGYHLNYQGNEYRRAMIDLGIGEKVSGSLL